MNFFAAIAIFLLVWLLVYVIASAVQDPDYSEYKLIKVERYKQYSMNNIVVFRKPDGENVRFVGFMSHWKTLPDFYDAGFELGNEIERQVKVWNFQRGVER